MNTPGTARYTSIAMRRPLCDSSDQRSSGCGCRRAAGRAATGHAEQGIQVHVTGVLAETRRHRAEQAAPFQHLVIPGEIAHRQQLDAGVLLQLPVGGAQFTTYSPQAGLVQFALPVGLQGFFQFTVATDTRKTKGMGQGHVRTLQQINKMLAILGTPSK